MIINDSCKGVRGCLFVAHAIGAYIDRIASVADGNDIGNDCGFGFGLVASGAYDVSIMTRYVGFVKGYFENIVLRGM